MHLVLLLPPLLHIFIVSILSAAHSLTHSFKVSAGSKKRARAASLWPATAAAVKRCAPVQYTEQQHTVEGCAIKLDRFPGVSAGARERGEVRLGAHSKLRGFGKAPAEEREE